ncbi:MAG TPA: AMP-binding protein, partial [Chloroflexota bacterium]|nr:AMP-binding protein [Chloroflexota bacterium]
MTALDVEIARPWLDRYPPDVPAHIDYPNISIGETLEQTSRSHGDAEAVVFQGSSLSWRRINADSNRLAGALRSQGVGKGDRVALLLPNVPHFVVAYYAALKLGAIVVATSPLFADVELQRYIQSADPKVLITLDILYPRVESMKVGAEMRAVFVGNVLDFFPAYRRTVIATIQSVDATLDRLSRGPLRPVQSLATQLQSALGRSPTVRRVRDIPRAVGVSQTREALSFSGQIRAFPDEAPGARVDPGDVAALLYTTGTTGTPKAAMLTHRNLLANAWQMRSWFPELKEGRETILAVLPFFHAYGLTLVMNAGLVLAARSVLIPRPVISDIFEAIRRFRPTALPGVPTLFVSIINSDRVAKFDLRSIRVCVSGGAPLPLEVKQRFDALTGGHLYEGYGLTEASPLTHAHPSNQAAPAGSIGIPVADTDAMIVDDNGAPL